MGNNLRYVYYYVVTYLVGISLAKHYHRIGNESSEILAAPGKMLDLRGTLRQSFFTVNALAYNETLKNSICSPISAMMPLGKLALGAVNDTLIELLESLGLSKKVKVKNHFKRLIAEMKYLPGVKLSVASRFYVGQDTHLKAAFRDAAQEIFGSTIQKANFYDPVSTTKLINNWVAAQTENKIKEIVSTSDISPMSSVVIVNAVYYKGKWLETFTKLDKKEPFQGVQKTKNISMMKLESLLYYTNSKALNSQLVRVPYVGEKAYFLIVMPNPGTELLELLRDLERQPEILDLAIMKMKQTFVNLSMPIFKIQSEMNLKKLYRKIGVKRIFHKDSGLDDMVRNQTIFISGAKQKAYIEVNVLGTEAAAATVLNVLKLSYFKSLKFLVNRPFLFSIILQNQQIFSGVFANPYKDQ